MGVEISLMSWSLVLYPVSWLACILYLCLFFSLILMRLKLNLVNGLYALDFCTSAVFILIEVSALHRNNISHYFIVALSLSNSCCRWLVHLPRKYSTTNSGFPRISQWYLHKVSFSIFTSQLHPNTSRYWEFGSFIIFINISVMYCVMFARKYK